MKAGDYVRTKDYQNIRSRIGKIIKQDGKYYYLDIDEDTQMVWEEDTILKSSPNIIDLIEVGDYVNGSKIIELATNIDGKILYLETDITEFDNVYACGNINIYEKDIKSIVTHEQFSQMEYKVGD